MPTGYTADIYDAKNVSFQDYLLHCCRAFGACLDQRDDKSSDLPRLQKPTDYYQKELDAAEKRLEQLRKLSASQAEKKAKKEREEAIQQRRERDQKAMNALFRYKSVLHEVRQWQPPTPDHQNLKDFMIEQLEKSIDFDCHTGEWPKIPPVMSGEEWRQQEIEKELKRIARETRHNLEEIERVKGNNAWVAAVYKSVGRKPPKG